MAGRAGLAGDRRANLPAPGLPGFGAAPVREGYRHAVRSGILRGPVERRPGAAFLHLSVP